ncbi:MAG: hypothetical protein OXI57_10115 [Rhodospirillales bacterium]|nr:hypothetical protein [Rhodospirillales bacterium]
MTDIPKVEDSGAAGTQEATSRALVLEEQKTPFGQTPIADTIQGLASSNARSMGGAVVANLLSGSFSQVSFELQDAKRDLQNTRGKLEEVRDELSRSKTRVAVLEERVSNTNRQKHLRNIAIAGGSILFGLAVQLGSDELGVLPFLLGGIGLVFVLMGWFWPSREKNH